MRFYRSSSWLAALTLAASLLWLAPPASAQPEFTEDEVQAIEGILRNYLRENPEAVIDALRLYQEREKQREAERTRELIAEYRGELEGDAGAAVAGNPDGDVTVVEFFDYRCAFCKRIFPTLVELLETDKEVRFVYKEFPILGPDSIFAARAAIASRPQGKYKAFHDGLMAARGTLSADVVFQIAAEAGLDVEQLKKDLQKRASEIDAIIRRNHALARQLGIRGTPTFVIGDALVRGAVPKDRLLAAIEQARKDCLTC